MVDGTAGRRVVTPHYRIYSTVANEDFLQSLGQLMEGALFEYRRLAPAAAGDGPPMECYLFATRPQWARFTRERTAPRDAVVYLRINRGGYTVGDQYVAYFLGDVGTFCVASHEGFHQFAARHLKNRIPPFLEEGLACMFEDISWEGRLPRWDLSVNFARQAALRRAVQRQLLLPLEDLVGMHAGLVISKRTEQIAAFYAECWAFARFLREYDHGRYRSALAQMLHDAAEGTLFNGAPAIHSPTASWRPQSAKPMLEHYLATDLKTIEPQFREWVFGQ